MSWLDWMMIVIGLAGAMFLAHGVSSMWARRGSAERLAELDRAEAFVQRWQSRRRS